MVLSLDDNSEFERVGSVRVLVASDTVGSLSSARAGAVIGSGWSGEDVRVLPIGEAGAGFVTAYADLVGAELVTSVESGCLVSLARTATDAVIQVAGVESVAPLPLTATSRPIGSALARILAERRPDRLLVDLAGLRVHDAGAGLLAGLGATADRPLTHGPEPLGELSHVDLEGAAATLAGVDLVGVVPTAQIGQHLLGLRGITAQAGPAAGLETDDLLRIDAALDKFARLAAPEQAIMAGAGACGGLGFAVLALGGRLVTGPDLAFSSPAGLRAAQGVDLVLTGCTVFDFARRGGGVVSAAAERAATALSPCVLIAGEVVVGSREMRTMGIEAAYAVNTSTADAPTGEVSEDDLRRIAGRVARSWRW